jgi:predicted amidophosphoribosyltransferase
MAAAPAALCAECWGTVRFIERPFCEVSGAPFDHDRGDGMRLAGRHRQSAALRQGPGGRVYDGAARKLAHGLKYSDRADLAAMMADGWCAPGVRWSMTAM